MQQMLNVNAAALDEAKRNALTKWIAARAIDQSMLAMLTARLQITLSDGSAHQLVIEGPSYRAKLAPKHRLSDDHAVREEVVPTP